MNKLEKDARDKCWDEANRLDNLVMYDGWEGYATGWRDGAKFTVERVAKYLEEAGSLVHNVHIKGGLLDLAAGIREGEHLV